MSEAEIYARLLTRMPEHDVQPSLDRVRDALDLLGSPQDSFRMIHVTGTNGKTSTSRMAEALVRAHDLRTGLFTSPHLTSVRERIVIDGEPISEDSFVRVWEEIEPIIALADERSKERGGPALSYFECLAVLAYAAFADAPVDVAVVEVGMGGVWDATNVADGDVAVIAPISMDHAQWLGDSLEGIAAEKAGIIKDGAPVIVAEQSESARGPIVAAAAERGATVRWEDQDIEVMDRQPGVGGQLVTLRTPAATYADIFVPLHGEYQAHNALLALAAVEALMAGGGDPSALDGAVVEAGFDSVIVPGRLETVRTSPVILVDAAHNPAGADALLGALEEAFAFERLVGVVGVLDDKDAEGILAALEPVLDHVVVTHSSSPRAIDPEELADIARDVYGDDRVSVEERLPNAIDAAVQEAERGHEHGAGVLVVGSVTLIAEARILLRADERRVSPVPVVRPTGGDA